ncbi:BadF/BadG/BcrA/BcrD ATPase family protein [Paenibacillus sp. HB172176]|uniref:N-acetylglucosamine kinase n=1 Tax=Paenibacillus sp. HB172176 TaxID=2493690 RepID=UPI00143A4BEA|nr:BadF/BadG/BcrA/BcrD ATPase family protein [Paenibacillus sp. HB172176]
MRYVAGLDGGGTKTAVAIADEYGRVIHEFVAGPLNYNGGEEAAIRATLAQIYEVICHECRRHSTERGAHEDASGHVDGARTIPATDEDEGCSVICIGAAGISNPLVSGRLTSGLREAGYRGKLVLVGDHETALCGAHEGLTGMILIAGTGSIAYGRNSDGKTHRAGGFGHLIDDEGSGYSIGRDLLSAVVKADDGRLNPTLLSGLVYEWLKLETISDIVGFVYDKNRGKKDIAALAPLLSVACDAGDAAALAIAEKHAFSLVETAAAIVQKLDMANGELALLGSVLQRNRQIREAFETMLREKFPMLQCIDGKKDAAYGAVILALDAL